MKACVIGTGYVGLTTGVTLAFLGHRVCCVDHNPAVVAQLRAGKSPIYEEGIGPLLEQTREKITFTTELFECVRGAEFIFIAVGTPGRDDGSVDCSYVEEVALALGGCLDDDHQVTVVTKSTVPIGTNARVKHLIAQRLKGRGVEAHFEVASNPEFLREGQAFKDALYPDRIVIGCPLGRSPHPLVELYRPIIEQQFKAPDYLPRPVGYTAPAVLITDLHSAEMIKYAANAFLALKVSFINEMARVCEATGADISHVARGIGLDQRIGPQFLKAGLGWGGSCFPKDTAALMELAGEHDISLQLVSASRQVNADLREQSMRKLQRALYVLRGKIIAVLGLSFKPHTDDVRDSPAIDIIRRLIQLGAFVRAHDPVAMENAAVVLEGTGVELFESPEGAIAGADALLIATEWPEYGELDLELMALGMRNPVLVDGRNIYEPERVRAAGLRYFGFGRG